MAEIDFLKKIFEHRFVLAQFWVYLFSHFYVYAGYLTIYLIYPFFDFVQEGKGLLQQDHYAHADIKKRLEELELSWEALMAASAEKKDRLQDAYQVGALVLSEI